jgi:hypothetical protein
MNEEPKIEMNEEPKTEMKEEPKTTKLEKEVNEEPKKDEEKELKKEPKLDQEKEVKKESKKPEEKGNEQTVVLRKKQPPPGVKKKTTPPTGRRKAEPVSIPSDDIPEWKKALMEKRKSGKFFPARAISKPEGPLDFNTVPQWKKDLMLKRKKSEDKFKVGSSVSVRNQRLYILRLLVCPPTLALSIVYKCIGTKSYNQSGSTMDS